MASRLNPYLNFRGNARQAIEFYQSVLGGEVRLSTFGDMPGADAAIADQIMHGQLETPNGYTLMVSDLPPTMPYNPGDNITVSISGDDAVDMRGYFQKLSAAGKVSVPLEKQMWGDEFGACVDQFGIQWMVNITQN